MKFIFTSFVLSLCIFMCRIQAQVLPLSLDTNYSTQVLLLSPSLTIDTIFKGYYDYVFTASGDSARAKANMDFTGIEPYVYNSWPALRITVNHEITYTKDSILGDGGGQTTFDVLKQNGKWVVRDTAGKKFFNIDFSNVGQTNKNCSGGMMTNYHTMSCEEFPPTSNTDLWAAGAGFQDTSDYIIPAGNGIYSNDTLQRWQNMGWVVETDPGTRTAVRKVYGMGRFSHECACALNDTVVFLTNDDTPAALFKYVASAPNDFSSGTLYTYRQLNDSTGTWIKLPASLDSMLVARDVAFAAGASLFVRLEGCAFSRDKSTLYVSETGSDGASLKSAIAKGAYYSPHLLPYDTLMGTPADSVLFDPYGRVMKMDLATGKLNVLLAGGNSANNITNLASPDNIAVGYVGTTEVMIIHEDLIAKTFNRMPDSAATLINEIFLLDLAIDTPTVNDLIRIGIGPDGSETTGGVFANDTDSYFFNIMHPSGNNPFPFNTSVTVAVRGLQQYFPFAINEWHGAAINIWPNPSEGLFNASTLLHGVHIYDIAGRMVGEYRATTVIDLKKFDAGIYVVVANELLIPKIIYKK